MKTLDAIEWWMFVIGVAGLIVTGLIQAGMWKARTLDAYEITALSIDRDYYSGAYHTLRHATHMEVTDSGKVRPFAERGKI